MVIVHGFKMNQPSYSSFEILQQLKTSFLTNNQISNLFPSILLAFKNEEDINSLSEIISIILGIVAQKVPLQELETLILQPFLKLVKQYISKVISAIHDVLQATIFEDSTYQEIKNYLEVCTRVLDDTNNFLSYVASLEEVTVPNICSIPINIAQLVYQIFSHCQKSKEEYKSAFPIVRNELMSLFQTCHKVQLNLFLLLNEKLYFNCKYESELQLLIDKDLVAYIDDHKKLCTTQLLYMVRQNGLPHFDAMEILASMADIVADLDTMSLVAHWKGYALLTQKYSVYLRPRMDIDQPIVYLAANISNQLSNLTEFYQNNEKKIVLRALKITSLQLKVLIKLCEHYKGYLGESITKLLDCLVTLCVNTTNYLQQKEVPPDIVSQVMSQLSAGAAPLTTHLIPDPGFVKEYMLFLKDLNQKPALVQAGFCQLTNLILKKLTHLCLKDEEILNLWISPNLQIVDLLFNLLHKCSKRGELSVVYEEDIYQSLLVNMTGLLVTKCSADMFPTLEKYLSQHLLQPSLWPAMFSSDLICLVGRFGSSELCNELTCLLRDMLDLWPVWDRRRPEWVYVSWTTTRLTHILSEEHLQHFQSRLPLCSAITNNLSIMLTASHPEEKYENYQCMIKSFTLRAEFMLQIPEVTSGLTDYLSDLWWCLAAPYKNNSPESSQWLYRIYSVTILATCASAHALNNTHILNILDALISLSSQKVPLFSCGACEFLRTLASKTFDNDSTLARICNKMSFLFVQLMKNEDPVVKSFALETFSFFAYLTKYEHIVADAVANDCKLQTEITDYLEYTPVVNCDEDINLLVKYPFKTFLHTCSKTQLLFPTKTSNDTEPNPCKKLKVSQDDDLFLETLQRLEDDLEQLESICSRSVHNKNHSSRLNVVISRLSKLIK